MRFWNFAKLLSTLIILVSGFAACSQVQVPSSNETDESKSANRPKTTGALNLGRRVTLLSSDNTVIVGTFFEAVNSNSPAVLLLHQFGSDRHSFDEFANKLQTEGFGVLAIDGRGFGESTKTGDGKVVPVSRTNDSVKGMISDVNAAIEFLSKQNNVDATRIGIIGASYGSSLALMYAANHPNAKAVVLLSPGLNYFGNMPTEPAIKIYGDRSLLMVAAEDDSESADSVRKLKSYDANERFESKIFNNGGHGTALFKADIGLDDLILRFLSKNL